MNEHKARGTWGVRMLVRFFTLVLAVLIYWLLGFFVKDIKTIPGPDFAAIEKAHLDAALLGKASRTDKAIQDLDRTIAGKQEQLRLAGDNSQNLQRTLTQLAELQRLSLEKGGALSDAERENLSTSMKSFLDSQKSCEELNRAIAALVAEKATLAEEKVRLGQELDRQRSPAREEYNRKNQTHRLRLAFYQLLILVPLLVAAGYLLVARRGSLYFPLFLASGAATLVKVTLVIHEYFPTRYFKYVLILVLLGVVARLLVHFIRTIAFPKTDWLLRRYREAYERFLCPVCDYPIRTGPRRFLFWTRRTVNRVLPPLDPGARAEPYTCPACGTVLFETCAACQEVRHSLLTHCEHCGAAKAPAQTPQERVCPAAVPGLRRVDPEKNI